MLSLCTAREIVLRFYKHLLVTFKSEHFFIAKLNGQMYVMRILFVKKKNQAEESNYAIQTFNIHVGKNRKRWDCLNHKI